MNVTKSMPLTPGRQVRHRPGQGQLSDTDGEGVGMGAQGQEGDRPVTTSREGEMMVPTCKKP